MPVSKPLYYLADPQQDLLLPSGVHRTAYRSADGTGQIWTLLLYPGVLLLAGSVRMPQFALPYMEEYPYLKLNYCTGGRCEVPLDNSRFAYIESGRLSVDLHQSVGALVLPTGLYQGLELILNLDKLAAHYPAAWQECGIRLLDAPRRMAGHAGSVLLRPAPAWDALARQLAERLTGGGLTLEEGRYRTLQLLYLLGQPDQREVVSGGSFLTRGQRALVRQAEQRLTGDLSARVSIETVAAGLGISASALKKYFGQMYGKPISAYLREKRMEQARRLLAGSDESIGAVALAVGYQNQGKFGAVFGEATGTTPSEYRRLCRAGQIEKGVNEV